MIVSFLTATGLALERWLLRIWASFCASLVSAAIAFVLLAVAWLFVAGETSASYAVLSLVFLFALQSSIPK